jgi:hypothetical protein
MLMTLPEVRQYTPASSRGLAARPVLSNLFAGVRIEMAQPIRIEDGVVIEGEFGNVEEITSTYVVVRLWDLRRMILPLTYFIEKPFQNWSREADAMIGTVMLCVDVPRAGRGHPRQGGRDRESVAQIGRANAERAGHRPHSRQHANPHARELEAVVRSPLRNPRAADRLGCSASTRKRCRGRAAKPSTPLSRQPQPAAHRPDPRMDFPPSHLFFRMDANSQS